MYLACCKIVGVKPGASLEEIKTAYRKAAKELHPDINDSEKAHQYFVILQNAYQYLVDHPYSDAEVDAIVYQAAREQKQREKKGKRPTYYQRPNSTTLREILRESPTARRIYIFFHLLFIIIGVLLLFSSIFDIFFHPLYKDTDLFSAYFTLISGFLFGIAFTSIFSVSIINFFRNQ